MSIFTEANNLKEMLQKATPTLDDIERITVLCLEDIAATFLKMHLVHRHMVIPGVIRGAQAFAGIPEMNINHSWIVRRATVNNLKNSINVWIKLGRFNKEEVLERVKKGCNAFIEKVIKENEEKTH